jgi:hypothetical protein
VTAQEAINKSLTEDRTVALDFDARVLDEILNETHDYVNGPYCWQFWGETRGKSWHIRMNHPRTST